MNPSWDVHDDMNLYITSEQFIIEPNCKDELLVIDRRAGKACVQTKKTQLQCLTPTRRICGVLGCIRLLGGCHYLIVATHRLYVGLLNGAIIWRLAGYDILPYIPNLSKQYEQNDIYLQMLRKTLDTKYFFFSYWYDLTHSLQRLQGMPPEFMQNGLFERADSRFVWNGYLLNNFNCADMQKFQLPITLGFVSINQVQINGQTFFWTIISRRSVKRAGTRYFSRGIDDEGNVSNYVETEQIIEYNGQRISFVQIRGSMPFYWHQLPNLRYKPPPTLIAGKDHLTAMAKHFEQQVKLYGRIVCVNLIDHKGPEGELEKSYRIFVEQLNNPSVRYEAFDFHTECKKMKYERLNILINRLAQEFDEFSVFHLRDNGSLASTQKGVFRTNCIDNLDRTNVVQSMLARRLVNEALQNLGIMKQGEKIEYASPKFASLFSNVWADHADLISLQYSGTGALKTDFTRTGKRTKAGMIQDGQNSLTRYYLNNFADGLRQDGYDLFLGNYIVRDEEGKLIPSPLNVQRSWRYKTFPSVLVFAVAMLFISSILPDELNTENMLFMLFWGAMIGASASGMFHYANEFVDWPRLFPPIKFEV